MKSRFLILLSIPIFIFSALASTVFAQTEDDRAILEKQLAEAEEQIAQYEATVSTYKKQGKSLQSEIDRLNINIKKLNLQIKSIEISLQKLDKEIYENKTQVTITENKLDFNKRALSSTLQGLYEKERVGLFEVLLKNPTFSNFIDDVNNLLVVQDNLRVLVQKVEIARDELLEKKEELAIKKADAEALQKYHQSQKVTVSSTKKQKDTLLAATKGQESKYQELLRETKKTAAQIRSQIFKFLGGGELSFEEAYKFARVAEGATGVRAAMVLAVLDKESAFGQNVGRCSYKTAMHPRRDIPVFLALVAELGINPDTINVSCANRDGAYGGAMGPAQFIPSTWELYKDRIGSVTGNNPPNPWNNSDAFIATALYLKDAGAHSGATLSEERAAAARYYAGARWQRYLWTYGDRVVQKAKVFQADIDVLEER